MFGRRAAALLALLLVAPLAGCGSDGDAAALDQLKDLQASLLDEASQHYRRGTTDPVWAARWAINDSGTYAPGDGRRFEQQVTALSWTSTDGLVAEIDLRLVVTTPGFQANSIGDTSYGPGSATRCVREVLGTSDDRSEVIDCDDRPDVPVPPAPPSAPPLDSKPLAKALRSPDLDRAVAAARQAYPGLSVSSETRNGRWAVAVVRPAPDLDCVGGVREPNGQVTVSSPAEIRPGEGDCDPIRFLDPNS